MEEIKFKAFNLADPNDYKDAKKLIIKKNVYAGFAYVILLIGTFLVNLQMVLTSVCGNVIDQKFGKPVATNFLLIFYWIYGIFQIVVGVIADTIGSHWTFAICYFFIVIGCFIIAYSKNLYFSYFGRAVEAFGCSLQFVTTCKWLNIWWLKKYYQKMLSIMLFIAYLGCYCATVPLKLLFEKIGFKALFTLISCIFILCFLFALFYISDTPEVLGFISLNSEEKIKKFKSKTDDNSAIGVLSENSDENKSEKLQTEKTANSNSIDDEKMNIETVVYKNNIDGIKQVTLEKKEEEINYLESIDLIDSKIQIKVQCRYKNLFKLYKSGVPFNKQVNIVFKVKENYTHFFLIMFSGFLLIGTYYALQGGLIKETTLLIIYGINEEKADLVQSMLNIFSCLGALTSFVWTDYKGRKFSQIFSSIIHVLCFMIMIIFTLIEIEYTEYVYGTISGFVGYFGVLSLSASISHINDKIDPAVSGFIIGIYNMSLFVAGAIFTQISNIFLDKKSIFWIYVIFLIVSVISLILISFTKEISEKVRCLYKKRLNNKK